MVWVEVKVEKRCNRVIGRTWLESGFTGFGLEAGEAWGCRCNALEELDLCTVGKLSYLYNMYIV